MVENHFFMIFRMVGSRKIIQLSVILIGQVMKQNAKDIKTTTEDKVLIEHGYEPMNYSILPRKKRNCQKSHSKMDDQQSGHGDVVMTNHTTSSHSTSAT